MTLFSTERDPLVRYKPLKVQRQWLKLYGLLLIFAYAFIALFIQGTPPIWIRTTVDGFLREYPAINYPEVRGFLNLLLGVLHPLYWLHFLPLIGGAWLGRILTLRFLQNFYELANLDEARLLWDRLRNGSTAKYDPNKSESQDFNAQSINQIGGPGYVKLPRSHAAVTELNGKFRNVIIAGKKASHLAPFETLYTILDLREKSPPPLDIPLTTKEGFNITAHTTYTYQIRHNANPFNPEESQPDQEAIRTLAYREFLVDDQIARWHALPKAIVERTFQEYFAASRLDTLFKTMSLEELPYVIKPHPQLVEKLTDQIKQEFDKNGLTLIQFHISNIDLPPEMDETLNRYWANHGRKLQPTEGFTPLSGYTAEEQLQIKIRQNIAGELSESLSRNRNRPNPFIDLQRTNVTDMITHLEGMLTQSQTDPAYLSPDAKQTIDNLLFTLRNYS